MISLENSVGLKVKITTNNNAIITGVIHSYNPNHGIISITDPEDFKKPKSTTLQILKTSFISDISFVNEQEAQTILNEKEKENEKSSSAIEINKKFENMLNKPSYVSIPAIGSNFQLKLANNQQKFKLNKILNSHSKMSKEGKEIFKELFNLLPQGDVNLTSINSEIVIFENHIRISSPYRPDDCRVVNGTGEEEDQQLEYITNVVKSIWEKLESQTKGG
ncbi:hypothetical protein B5S32_g2577 [[Candida] boidinii]|nr:hypothetical protein B5S32_g2577 [[Candida] boidinii]